MKIGFGTCNDITVRSQLSVMVFTCCCVIEHVAGHALLKECGVEQTEEGVACH